MADETQKKYESREVEVQDRGKKKDEELKTQPREEEGEDGEKRKKIEGDHHHHKEEDTSVPVEKVEVVTTAHSEEKKGFLDKIKEKLPGHKKTEEAEATPPPSPPPVASLEHGEGAHHEGEERYIREDKREASWLSPQDRGGERKGKGEWCSLD
ncbi:Dehydrin DHN1 [Glycine max]|uniref:phosphoprotein ECPP44-like n=1 Tax=Glycine soja TaxID=3848 RepID=UPI000549F88A|nr:phosphoprotein ECPP44-like [Glycine soja]KAG5018084.1 hypothetical protein JHK87_013939 [Glycine soja]KAG5044656.1 hypothetical protein JHK86_014062 [Glycine max]KAH1244074.1 Dehydrin DHN1 [Glycine max]KHN20041.1 hypothetical protein glysoja_014619 [Glycine soja]